MKLKFLIFNCFVLFGLAVSAQTSAASDTIYKLDLPKNAENFSKGLESKYNENYEAAIEYFETALKFNKDDDASMYELSELYKLQNRDTEAFSMIEQASKLQPENKWYQQRLAQFYLQNSDYQSYINIYDKLTADDPANLDYLENYIDVLLRIGEYEKVIEKLNVMEELFGKSEMITMQKIEIYKNIGNSSKMIEEMENLIKIAPSNTRYLATLAEIYMKNGKDGEAYKLYLKIKELEPDNKYINVSLYDYYQNKGEIDKAFDEFILAIRNTNLDYETKVQIYELWSENNVKDNDSYNTTRVAEIGQAFVETYPQKNVGYYILGVTCSMKNDFKQAQSYFVQALEKDKNNFATFYQLCYVDLNLNDYQQVTEHTELALDYFPEQPVFYLFRGIACYNLKDYDNAIKNYEKGRKLSANRELTKDFDIYIGDTYNLMGDRKKSYEAYDRVLNADPENIYVLNNYAYYLSLDNQDLERALEMSSKTIKAEPKNAVYLDTYAWILYKMNRFQEAKKWMEKVFKYDKKPSGVNYEHLGDILYKLGDTKAAVQNWKKAKKAGETSEFIDDKIKDGKLYE
ncbi:MAG: hypothetical protein MJZ85_02005 [Bacteroidales bacterium]|nr:hypothetical protein [Bacteroidales bacterium]